MKAQTNGNGKMAVRELIDHIRQEGLTVGDRLPSIRQMAADLNTGTHPVRDALLAAQAMGIVKVHPRAGAFVQSLDYSPLVEALANTVELILDQDDHSISQLFETRRVIEEETVAIAAAQRRPEDLFSLRQALEEMEASGEDRRSFIEADERFHLGIARIAGNSVSVSILRALLTLLRPHRMNGVSTPEKRRRIRREHEDLYSYILEGDAKMARAKIREHLELARKSVA